MNGTTVEPASYVEIEDIGQSLLHVGGISVNTYSLLTNVLARMSRLGVRQIALSLEMIQDSVVVRGEGLVSVPVKPRMPYYARSLQELHFTPLIHNHYIESDLDKEDSCKYHFSLDPFLTYGRQWGPRTPIIYRLTDLSADEIEAQALATFYQIGMENTQIEAAK